METQISGFIEPQSGLALAFTAPGEPVPPVANRYASGLTKRLVDIAVAATMLALLSAPLLLIALLVRLTSQGPVLFQQARHGRDGTIIKVLKFRTLFAAQADAAGTVQAVSGDARITPLGHVLRRTSLDELPQLINVLKGEMSLVGPRPHPIGMRAGGMPYEELVPYYHLRHCVRPGLTGWAQANGYRGPTVSHDVAVARIKHDLAYIEHASLQLDLEIILRTFRTQILTGNGT